MMRLCPGFIVFLSLCLVFFLNKQGFLPGPVQHAAKLRAQSRPHRQGKNSPADDITDDVKECGRMYRIPILLFLKKDKWFIS